MTTSSSERKSGPYSGNGVTTVFSYGWLVQATSEIVVQKIDAAGVATTLTLGTHYTVSGVDNPAGGNVTMLTAPATGESLLITGNTPLTQDAAYTANGTFPATSHEAALDRVTRQVQELAREMKQTVRANYRSSARIILPPPPTTGQAQLVRNLDGSISQINLGDLATAAIAGLTPVAEESGGTARTLSERFGDIKSLLDFVTDERGGAVRRAAIRAGTSPGDDGPAVAAAVAFTLLTGREVWVEGGYVCSTEIANFASGRWRGPGYIKLGSAPKWYVEPNLKNTGFTPLGRNTMYVSEASGSDSNSGLSSSYPKLTLQAAVDMYEDFTSGFFEIKILDGVFRETTTLNQVSSSRASQFLISGAAVDTWNNTTPPDRPVAITAITSANPAVVTAAGHGRAVGEQVVIYDALAAASAEHGSIARVHTITAVAGNDITLDVDGSGWAAYVSGGKLIDRNGNSPKVIFFGAKSTTTWAIAQDSQDYVTYSDIMFVNWGTKAVAQNAGGIIAFNFGTATLQNIHAYGCGNRFQARNYSIGDTSAGGYVYDCGTGDWCITGRASFGGPPNPGSAALTTTAIYDKCIYPVAAWEGAEIHFDGCIVRDCTNFGYAYGGGSHIVSYYMRFENNTGSPLDGFIVEHGANLSRSTGLTDVLTGAFNYVVSRRDASITYSNEVRNTWQNVYHRQISLTPASGEQTVLTTPVLRYEMNVPPQGFRAELWGIGTNAVDTITLRVKKGATTVYSRVEALDASAREMRWLFEGHANGFNALRMTFQGLQLIGSTTTSRFDISSPAFDTTGGDDTLTVTVEIANAADSMNIIYSVMDKFGC